MQAIDDVDQTRSARATLEASNAGHRCSATKEALRLDSMVRAKSAPCRGA